MNFEVNRNGNTANDIRDQFVTLHDLVNKLTNHLVGMDYHHGRNYQTLEDPQEAQRLDLEEYRKHRVNIQELANFAMSGAARAIRQREDL